MVPCLLTRYLFTMNSHIRPFTLADSDRIGEILADGWAQAYGGFMPANVLAPRADRALRRAELHDFLSTDFDPSTEAIFVSEIAGAITGFVHVVLGDKADLGTGGYVSLLYVDAKSGGRGQGRALLAKGAGWLTLRTDGTIAIAAFKDNPFHSFYAHLGGAIAKVQDVRIDGFACQSIVYLWPNAGALQRSTLESGAGGGARTRMPIGEGF
jgi:GNAT superfamily N-acetyltransferase